MPKKPEKWVLEAAKKNLDPVKTLEAIINDCPEIAQALIDKGLAKPAKE